MGIKYFYSQWIKTQNFKDVDIRYVPGKYLQGLSIDMNGLFHAMIQVVYNYTDKNGNIDTKKLKYLEESTAEELQLEYFNAVTNKLEEVMKIFKPKRYIFLAVDGVAPNAKINQQRLRRYKSAFEKSQSNSKSFFDSICITPGTDFMNSLDSHISNWLKTSKFRFPELVVYSSHRLPGEGEHKIFQLLREYLNSEEIIPKDDDIDIDNNYHGVYGLDADLVMLSSLCSIPKMVLIRENYKNLVNIKKLREQVISRLTNQWSIIFDPKIIIQDFVLMVCLIGNDFLTSIISLENIYFSLPKMFEIYNGLEFNLTDSTFSIIYENLHSFLHYLKLEEPSFLLAKASKGDKYLFSPLDSIFTKSLNKNFIPDLLPYDSKSHIPMYSNKYIISEPFSDSKFDKFRSLWYSKILGPYGSVNYPFDEDDVKQMCNSYIYGLQWVLYYYCGNLKNNNFIYNYMYSPLLFDLTSNLENLILTKSTPSSTEVITSQIKPNFLYQLVSVIPPQSVYLIPPKFRKLILDGGSLNYMCPLKFKLDFEGKNQDHEAIPLLPYLDISKIKYEVDLLCPSIKTIRKDENGIYYNLVSARSPNGFTFAKVPYVSLKAPYFKNLYQNNNYLSTDEIPLNSEDSPNISKLTPLKNKLNSNLTTTLNFLM